MICCTEPGLTETLYIFYIHTFCNMYNINILYIMSTDVLLLKMTPKKDTRPLLREGVPQGQTSNIQIFLIYGHEPQVGLDTKTV
jgi:hypothetical protein